MNIYINCIDIQKPKMEIINSVRKTIQLAPHQIDSILFFLKGDEVQKVMDLSKLDKIYTKCFGNAFYIFGKSVLCKRM